MVTSEEAQPSNGVAVSRSHDDQDYKPLLVEETIQVIEANHTESAPHSYLYVCVCVCGVCACVCVSFRLYICWCMCAILCVHVCIMSSYSNSKLSWLVIDFNFSLFLQK